MPLPCVTPWNNRKFFGESEPDNDVFDYLILQSHSFLPSLQHVFHFQSQHYRLENRLYNIVQHQISLIDPSIYGLLLHFFSLIQSCLLKSRNYMITNSNLCFLSFKKRKFLYVLSTKLAFCTSLSSINHPVCCASLASTLPAPSLRLSCVRGKNSPLDCFLNPSHP